jgi:hypothetical protein
MLAVSKPEDRLGHRGFGISTLKLETDIREILGTIQVPVLSCTAWTKVSKKPSPAVSALCALVAGDSSTHGFVDLLSGAGRTRPPLWGARTRRF